MTKINLTQRIKTGTPKVARKIVSEMGKGGLAPVIVLEAFVTGGRTYHAYKRDGFVEARERFTEEVLGAIFWFCGIDMFNKLLSFAGKKALGLKNVDFDSAKDASRNPIANFMHKYKKAGKIGESKLIAFKAGKILTSIVLANAVVGFVVPKLNQAITKKYQKSIQNLGKDNQAEQSAKQSTHGIDSFLKKTTNKQTNKDVSFSGVIDVLRGMTNTFETCPSSKLIATDVGVAGGRAITARNNHERTETLFRDLSSIYFYLFCRGHINKGLNWLMDRKTERIDPTAAHEINEHIIKNVSKDISVDAFKAKVLGASDEAIEAKMKNLKFNDDGTITLKKYWEQSKGGNLETAKKAIKMSQLQPKLEGVRILTKEQVIDLHKGGLLDNPDLLGKVFKHSTGGASTDSTKYVKEKELRALKGLMGDYIQEIVKKFEKAGNGKIEAVLKSVKRQNLMKNAFNATAGFAVCGYVLSTAIPKIQYWITKKRTGENKFPGTATYTK